MLLLALVRGRTAFHKLLPEALHTAAWSPIHLDVCFWMSFLTPLPDWGWQRCSGVVRTLLQYPCAMNPVDAALFSRGAKILSGEVVPKPVSQARADRGLSWGLWMQVIRHDALRLFHAEYWRAHHTAAFDHYPLWMKARSNDVEMKASVSQKQSPKPSKSL